MTAPEALFFSADRPLLRNFEQAFRSYSGRQCKCVERLRLCHCWRARTRSNLPVTVRLGSFLKQSRRGSPWHSDVNPLFSPAEDVGPVGGASSDSANGDCRRLGRWRRRRYGHPSPFLVPALATALGGTPGSDHVGKLGKARRMPNTSTRPMCRCHVSGIDLTLARRIGRIWTRPGRGNISLLTGKGQFVRADGAANLCAVRRSGRATTHTSSALRLDATASEYSCNVHRSDLKRGRGRARSGAR